MSHNSNQNLLVQLDNLIDQKTSYLTNYVKREKSHMAVIDKLNNEIAFLTTLYNLLEDLIIKSLFTEKIYSIVKEIVNKDPETGEIHAFFTLNNGKPGIGLLKLDFHEALQPN
jgi:hypothetical protein